MKTVAEVEDFISSRVDNDFVRTHYSVYALAGRVEDFVGEENVEIRFYSEEELYGTKRFADLNIRCADGVLSITIEQTGSDGVYATYIS